jgi:hypothetical protein
VVRVGNLHLVLTRAYRVGEAHLIDTTTRSATNDSNSTTRMVWTCGELFDDGSAIELVMAQHGEPELLLSTGGTVICAPEVTHRGVLYKPIQVNPCIWTATRLPDRTIDYASPAKLFAETTALLQERGGFSRPSAVLATAWTASTWLHDSLPSPPTLLVSGPDMDQAVAAFSVLSLVIRRPILLAEVGRNALHQLVAPLRPTLLINSPQMSPSVRRLCQASNYAGVFTLGNQALLSSVACSKAFFIGSERHDWWAGPAIHLALPLSGSFLPLDPRLQAELAEYFQPRWLKFRLDESWNVRAAPTGSQDGTHMCAAVRQLQACVQGQPEICGELQSMVRAQEEEARAAKFLDPSNAIVEVLWPLFHASEEPITVGTLTNYVNTLLASREGTRKYDAGEIGALLSRLSIGRRRKNSGVFLAMDQDSNRRVHIFASAHGLGNQTPDCTLCQASGISGDPVTEDIEDREGSEGSEGSEGICTVKTGGT